MPTDQLHWHCEWQVDRYRIGDLMSRSEEVRLFGVTPAGSRWDPARFGIDPYDRDLVVGNLLTYGGASALWDRFFDATPSITEFDNANAYLGVGDSSTAAAATQTDLQAATNKSRKAMQATYPSHTDGTTLASHTQIVFKSSWDTASGNYAWNEFGTFNASSSGRMLNRKVVSLGTKTSADTWVLTATLSLA